jgi:hypothetical protein
MVHPFGSRLRDFVDGLIVNDTDREQIAAHIAECEFCCEVCDNYRLEKSAINNDIQVSVPMAAKALADRFYAEALKSLNIELIPMLKEHPSISYLAAEGEIEKPSGVANLATFYSEKPEMILRVMRDYGQGYDYLQLTGNEPELVSNILLTVPELDREFVTDDFGRATFIDPLPQKIDALKWQIKMPDAVFALEPLQYNPEAIQYRTDMILETDRHDKIKINFEGKAEGKQINISILSLEGKADFSAVKVVVSCKQATEIKSVRALETCSFQVNEPGEEIKIRIFQ